MQGAAQTNSKHYLHPPCWNDSQSNNLYNEKWQLQLEIGAVTKSHKKNS